MTDPHLFSADVIMTPPARQLHSEGGIVAPAQECPLDLTIFMSCYNQQAFVGETIGRACDALGEVGRLSFEIIVVDDCSKDNSADVVIDYMHQHPDERIVLIRNKTNRGLARNFIDTSLIGAGKYYRLICGDQGESTDTMVRIFAETGNADLVIPYLVENEGKPIFRRALSKTYTSIINAVSGLRLRYYNQPAIYRRYDVVRWHPQTRGFGFQADLVCRLIEQGRTYKEIPIKIIERGAAHSTALSRKNFLSVAHTIASLMLRRLSNWIYR